MRKLILTVIIVCICFIVVVQLRPWITPNTYVSGWGGSSNIPEGSKTQLINFNATVINNGHYPVFVRRVDSVFSETAHPRFLSGDKSIQVFVRLSIRELGCSFRKGRSNLL